MAIVQASVKPIEHNLAIGQETYFVDQYVSLGYTRHTFEAQQWDVGYADLDIVTTIGEQSYFDTEDYIKPGYFTGTTPTFITTNVDADVSIPITAVVGQERYIDNTNYITNNYFQNTLDATVEQTASESILSSTVSLTAEAFELRQAEVIIASEVRTGPNYVEFNNYVEDSADYFEFSTPSTVTADAVINPVIAGTVNMTANADFVADIIISSSLSIVAIGGGEKPGEANLSATVNVNCDPDEIQAGTINASITASTNIFAGANRTASASADIELADVTVVASAVPTGISIFGGSLDLLVGAGVIRDNPRYTLLIPEETRVNTITQETREVIIPQETRELEFEV